MRAYQKEIIISIIAVLVMTLAIISFFKTMNTEKSNEREHIYKLISSDATSLIIVNRPAVFDRMMLGDNSFYDLFASEIPPLFLSFIKNNRQIELMIFSYHPQGVVCYIQSGKKVLSSIEKALQKEYELYSPITQTKDGIEYTFYPDTDGRFLGYYVKDGIWIGSYSKKLLEKTFDRFEQPGFALPIEMRRLVNSFDINAPLNIIFPTKELDLKVSQGSSFWRIEEKWLGADLFFSDGNFCCFRTLPYQSAISFAMYKTMGEVISQQIKRLYPRISLSFEVDQDDDFVYYTGCTPLPDLN